MLSFTLRLDSGANKHVSFESRTNGLCAYQTTSEAVQEALEKHPAFGTKFVLKGSKRVVAPKKEEPKELTLIPEVTSAADAKAYLVEKYEVSRTQIRSTKDIMRIAAQFGITFNLG